MLQLEIIGNLGADAQLREKDGRKFITFRVAHTEKFTRADGTEVNNTTWISCIINNDGGALLQYLKAGTRVFVRGAATLRAFSSEKARAFVGTADVNVRDIELVGSQPDEVPRQLVTKDAELVSVFKAFYVAEQYRDAQTLYDKHLNPYNVTADGWVTKSTQSPESPNNDEQTNQN